MQPSALEPEALNRMEQKTTLLGRRRHELTTETVTRMLDSYTNLLNTWEHVADGAALELQWPG